VFLYAGARTPALLPEVIAVGSIVIVLSIIIILAVDLARRWAERRIQALPGAAPSAG
jgi:hypothetical protein